MTHKDDALVVAELIQSVGLHTLDFLATWKLGLSAYTGHYDAETLNGNLLARITYHARSSAWRREHPETCEVKFGEHGSGAVKLGEEEGEVRERIGKRGITLLSSIPSLEPWEENGGSWVRKFPNSQSYLELRSQLHSIFLKHVNHQGGDLGSFYVIRSIHQGAFGALADVDLWLEERGVKLLESRAGL